VLVAVSSLPTMAVTRRIFELLGHEAVDKIPPILLTLTELPVYPGSGLEYEIAFTHGTASVKFSYLELVEDIDMDYVVLNVMTPAMLVAAWEAIVLERKVIVISNTNDIIIPCCEFLRRLVAPLTIVNTYVPLLPLQLIDTVDDTVDAPFPYLLGANTDLLKRNIRDLSDTVVVDLDMRTVLPRVSKNGKPEIAPSINLTARLLKYVNDIMLGPSSQWFNRATTCSGAAVCSPFSELSYTTRSNRIQEIFKRANLELIGARTCSVKAFWRRKQEAMKPMIVCGCSGAMSSSRKPGSMMKGFNLTEGICSGFMQLAKELYDENEMVSHFTPCWVEMDQYVFAVYEFADDLPILYLLIKDIATVTPIAIDPEGHVFEIMVKNMSYRLTVTDTESRQKWISVIDRRKASEFGANDLEALREEEYEARMRYLDYEKQRKILSSTAGGGGNDDDTASESNNSVTSSSSTAGGGGPGSQIAGCSATAAISAVVNHIHGSSSGSSNNNNNSNSSNNSSSSSDGGVVVINTAGGAEAGTTTTTATSADASAASHVYNAAEGSDNNNAGGGNGSGVGEDAAAQESTVPLIWNGFEMVYDVAASYESNSAADGGGGNGNNGAINNNSNLNGTVDGMNGNNNGTGAYSNSLGNGREDNCNRPTPSNPATLGLPAPMSIESNEAATKLAKEDSLFRLEFSRTQTMNFLHSQLECPEFQSIFQDLKVPMESLLEKTYTLDKGLQVVPAAQSIDAQVTQALLIAEQESHGIRDTVVRSRSSIRSSINSSTAPEIRSTSSNVSTHSNLDTNNNTGGTQGDSRESIPFVAAKEVFEGLSESVKRKSRTASAKTATLFGGFFNKKISAEEEKALREKLEQEQEVEARQQREKLRAKMRQAAIQSQMFVVTATYRRVQAELNSVIVDARMKALEQLVVQSSAAYDSDCNGVSSQLTTPSVSKLLQSQGVVPAVNTQHRIIRYPLLALTEEVCACSTPLLSRSARSSKNQIAIPPDAAARLNALSIEADVAAAAASSSSLNTGSNGQSNIQSKSSNSSSSGSGNDTTTSEILTGEAWMNHVCCGFSSWDEQVPNREGDSFSASAGAPLFTPQPSRTSEIIRAFSSGIDGGAGDNGDDSMSQSQRLTALGTESSSNVEELFQLESEKDIQDFIKNIQMCTSEAVQRKVIREQILSHLKSEHTRLDGDESYQPYRVIRQVLIGYMYESLDLTSDALQMYAVGGGLADQTRIMSCLVRLLLDRLDAVRGSGVGVGGNGDSGSSPSTTPTSRSRTQSPSLAQSMNVDTVAASTTATVGVVQQTLQQQQKLQVEVNSSTGESGSIGSSSNSSSAATSPTNQAREPNGASAARRAGRRFTRTNETVLSGDNNESSNAAATATTGRSKGGPRGENNVAPIACEFIAWAKGISPLIAKQAYRFVLELIYRELVVQLEMEDDTQRMNMNRELELGSFRTFPGSHRNVGAAQQKTARIRAKNSTLLNTDFEWTPVNPKDILKSDSLNCAVLCSSINEHRHPTKVSVLLLSSIKEILKTYCQSPAGMKNSKWTAFGYLKLKLSPSALEDLRNTSAFKAFEQHCCILQKMDIDGMGINERVLFFVNVYNTITVHAMIAKGAPGTSLLERSAFMRSSKYNINGVLYSLVDIEHGILRHKSSSPMLFGPLTISITFPERDPRRKYILQEARPNISFVLCNACVSSPALVVLKSPDSVNEEMKHYARRFLTEYVVLDPGNKTITLPGLLKYYWADFGGNRARVMKVIAQIAGSQFATDLKPYLSAVDGMRAKVEFAKFDWGSTMSISD